jgi:hypothetical protein
MSEPTQDLPFSETWTPDDESTLLKKREFQETQPEEPSTQPQDNQNEQDDQDDSPQPQPPASPCDHCHNSPHKYKCPSCFSLHCSLTCYKAHIGPICAGKVVATKYVKLSNYNVNNLRRDFEFLSSVLENSNRTKKKLSILEENLSKQKELMRFKILKLNAKRRNVTITLAPPIIQRHCRNISFYYTKDKIIYWAFEIFLYVCVEGENVKIFRWNMKPKPETMDFEGMMEDFPWDHEELVVAFGQLMNFEKFDTLSLKYQYEGGGSMGVDRGDSVLFLGKGEGGERKFGREDNARF